MSLNRSIITSIGVTFFLILSSCYHNGHVRSQRILEPGDKIFSPEFSFNTVETGDANWKSEFIDVSGIAGGRIGVSYLGYHRHAEQGGFIGLGKIKDRTALILGYDYRRVKFLSSGVPVRFGLYLENNMVMQQKSLNSGLKESNVLQVRPYLSTTSSPSQPLYAGLHAIMSLGNANMAYKNGYYYNWEAGEHQLVDVDLQYSIVAQGIGLTVGREGAMGKYLTQTQFDLTWMEQDHQLKNIEGVTELPLSDLHKSGFHFNIGLSIHRAPKSSSARRSSASSINVHPLSVQPSIPVTSAEKFDPITGLPIQQTETHNKVIFDPSTGEAIEPGPPILFDPLTGLPLAAHEKLEPVAKSTSLLTAEEKMALPGTTLSMVSFNGLKSDADVIDLSSTGLIVHHTLMARMDTLLFRSMNTIEFTGEKRGFGGCLKGGASVCGLFIVVPLAGALVSSELDLFDMMGLAPLAVAGGMVVGFNMPKKNFLDLTAIPKTPAGDAYKQELLYNLIKLTLKDGLPTQKLVPAFQNDRPKE